MRMSTSAPFAPVPKDPPARRSPGRRGRRRRPRRARPPRGRRGAGPAHRAVDALRSRLRRLVRPEVRPGVGRAQRRHRRDRPPSAHRAPGARRHRGRDAAGPRPLRLPRASGRVRGARGARHGPGDGLREPVRAPSRLHPQGHLQPQVRSSTSQFPESWAPRSAPLPNRSLVGGRLQAGHLGARPRRARERSARSGASRPGSGSRPSPTAT